jgi:hypothetical protein
MHSSLAGDTGSVPRPQKAAAVTAKDPVVDQVKPGEASTLRSSTLMGVSLFKLTRGWIGYAIWLAIFHPPSVCMSPRINDLEMMMSEN